MAKRPIPQEWQELMSDGWFNATGLTPYYPHDPKAICLMVLPNTDMRFVTESNNGTAVVYLSDGTVWLRSSTRGKHPRARFGAYVPCSNGEVLHMHHIMCRLADPFWNGGQAQDHKKEGRPKLGYVNFPAMLEEVQMHPEYVALQARESQYKRELSGSSR